MGRKQVHLFTCLELSLLSLRFNLAKQASWIRLILKPIELNRIERNWKSDQFGSVFCYNNDHQGVNLADPQLFRN